MSTEKEPREESPSEDSPREAPGPREEDLSSAAAAPIAPTAQELARRQLLGRVTLGLGVVCGAAVSVPGLGFVVAPLFRHAPRVWRAVGPLERFKLGETVSVVFEDASPLPWAGVTAKTAAWLRRVGPDELIAFSVNCAHLGCPVRWLQQARLFLCPCHGGVYYEDGSVAAGPPPHGLTRYPVRVADGQVEIRTGPIPIG